MSLSFCSHCFCKILTFKLNWCFSFFSHLHVDLLTFHSQMFWHQNFFSFLLLTLLSSCDMILAACPSDLDALMDFGRSDRVLLIFCGSVNPSTRELEGFIRTNSLSALWSLFYDVITSIISPKVLMVWKKRTNKTENACACLQHHSHHGCSEQLISFNPKETEVKDSKCFYYIHVKGNNKSLQKSFEAEEQDVPLRRGRG